MLALLFISFLALILIGIDVGLSMVLSAWIGIHIKSDRVVDDILIPQFLVNGVNFYALVQIPLFVLAGELMNRGGLTQRLIDWSLALVGRMRGALGHVTILTNLIMAGISGSAVADAVATGKPLIPAMQKRGYGKGYGAATVAAGTDHSPLDSDGGLCADRQRVGAAHVPIWSRPGIAARRGLFRALYDHRATARLSGRSTDRLARKAARH